MYHEGLTRAFKAKVIAALRIPLLDALDVVPSQIDLCEEYNYSKLRSASLAKMMLQASCMQSLLP